MSYPPGYDPRFAKPAWPALSPVGGPVFDPADPLISPDYAGWWRRGWTALRRTWRPLLLVHVPALAAIAALTVPAQLILDRANARLALAEERGDDPPLGEMLPAFGLYFGAAFIAAGLVLATMLAAARIVVTGATGGQARIGAALGEALRRLPALVGWYLLAGVIGLAALLACVLPIFYVTAVFQLLPVVVFFERGNAISRCFRLFHADLGAAVARIATLVGISFAVGMALGVAQFVISISTGGLDPMAADSAQAVTGSVLVGLLDVPAYLVSGLLSPWLVAAYADLRARHEPFTSAHLVADPATAS